MKGYVRKYVNYLADMADLLMEMRCCRLGLWDAQRQEAYIVPMNYGYQIHGKYGEKLTLYFHTGKGDGRKMRLLRAGGRVSFEIDDGGELSASRQVCQCTTVYQSMMGVGTVTFATTDEEKIYALQQILYHELGEEIPFFEKSMLDKTEVFWLEVIDWCGKSSE